MKLSLICLTGALVVALTAFACAGTDDDGSGATPSGDGDAATLPPPAAGGDDAASVDAGVDEPGDAAPRVCSAHGLCHTSLPPDTVLEGVWAAEDGTTAWAVSADGAVLRWNAVTNAWTVHASKLGPLHAIWGTSATDLWIGGDEGVYHGKGATVDAVAFALETFPAGPKVRITSVWGLSATDVYAAGTNEDAATGETRGRLAHYAPRPDAGAARWTFESVPTTTAYVRVWGSAGTGVWVGGYRPMVDEPSFTEVAVLRRAPSARNFVEVALPNDPDDSLPFAKMATLHGAVMTTDTTAWIFGRSVSGIPGLWQGTSADGGKTFTWKYARDGRYDDPAFNAVHGTLANDAWAVGDYGRVRHWDGTSWHTSAITLTHVPVIDPFYSVWSRGANDAWLVGDGIALHYDPSKKEGAQ